MSGVKGGNLSFGGSLVAESPQRSRSSGRRRKELVNVFATVVGEMESDFGLQMTVVTGLVDLAGRFRQFRSRDATLKRARPSPTVSPAGPRSAQLGTGLNWERGRIWSAFRIGAFCHRGTTVNLSGPAVEDAADLPFSDPMLPERRHQTDGNGGLGCFLSRKAGVGTPVAKCGSHSAELSFRRRIRIAPTAKTSRERGVQR